MNPGDTVFYDASYSLLLTRKLLLSYMIPKIKSAWVKILRTLKMVIAVFTDLGAQLSDLALEILNESLFLHSILP